MQAIVDDTDRGIVWSSNLWQQEGQHPEYNNTTHGTCHEGAEFFFRFNGTSVNVYGTISDEYQTTSAYTIDDGAWTRYTTPIVSSTVHRTLFYPSKELNPGEHTLSAILLNSTSSKASPPCFWVDFLMYAPLDSRHTQGANGGNGGGKHGLMAPNNMEMGDGSKNSDSDGSKSSFSSSSNGQPGHSNLGTIIGVIVPIFVALFACLGVFLLWRRHKKMKRKLSMLRQGGMEGGQNERTSVVVMHDAEAPPTFPSTAIFSTYYEPSYAPYSPTESDKTSLLPRQLAPARRPTKLSRGLSMLSRFSSTKKRTPSSKAPSDLVFAPPNSDPSANQSRVVIAAEKRGPMEFDGT